MAATSASCSPSVSLRSAFSMEANIRTEKLRFQIPSKLRSRYSLPDSSTMHRWIVRLAWKYTATPPSGIDSPVSMVRPIRSRAAGSRRSATMRAACPSIASRASPPSPRSRRPRVTRSGRGPFPDVAIVYNGQITDYYLWRNRLERRGYRFMLENDSELIAVWISDRMRRGMTKPAALGQSIREIDGVFTYLIADERSIGFAKDRWAIKPLVAMGDAPELAVATEEQAVRRIYREEGDVTNFDGPALTRTWLAAAAASPSDASAVEVAA